MLGGRQSASRGGLRFRRSSPQRSSPHAAAPAPGSGAGAASPGDTPRFDAPSFDALVRRAYYSHVSSQILVSNLPPWVRLVASTLRRARLPKPLVRC